MLTENIVSDFKTKSSFIEAYRIIRTNLNFLAKGTKSLLITSSEQSEGKSTVVANLGIVLAQAGMRVVIIDCDFRKARQHQIFNLENTQGLATLLAANTQVLTNGESRITTLDQVVQPTGQELLSVITSGPTPEDPTELLDSTRMEDILIELKDGADLVLLDSPPVLPIADATVLATIVDAVLIVTKAGVTKAEAAKKTKRQLERAKANIIGVVLNGIKRTESYHSYYGEG